MKYLDAEHNDMLFETTFIFNYFVITILRIYKYVFTYYTTKQNEVINLSDRIKSDE